MKDYPLNQKQLREKIKNFKEIPFRDRSNLLGKPYEVLTFMALKDLLKEERKQLQVYLPSRNVLQLPEKVVEAAPFLQFYITFLLRYYQIVGVIP